MVSPGPATAVAGSCKEQRGGWVEVLGRTNPDLPSISSFTPGWFELDGGMSWGALHGPHRASGERRLAGIRLCAQPELLLQRRGQLVYRDSDTESLTSR